jgi:hypothetical protein
MKKLSVVVLVLLLVSMVTYGYTPGNWEDNGSLPEAWTTGRVGIGTTSPYCALHVQYPQCGPYSYWQQSVIYGYNTATDYDPVGVCGRVNESQGRAIYGYNENSNGYGGYFEGRGYFSGNVGIGTTSPADKLEIANGGLRISNSDTPFIFLKDTYVGGWKIKMYQGGLYFQSTEDGGSTFSTKFSMGLNGTAHFHDNTIFDNNVGIGTTSPSAKLDIANLGGSNDVPILVMSENSSDEFIFIGDFAGSGATGNALKLETFWGNNAMTWRGDGNVGIGTDDPSDYKLAVNGHIRTKEITVESEWSDFVFNEDYNLMPLDKLERHIKKEKSLPGIPTEKEVAENGIELGEMQAKLLEKVEELTLYVIELKKENEELRNRITALEN